MYDDVHKLCLNCREDKMIPEYLRRELLILFYIINKNNTTTAEISKSLNLSKRSVKETLSTINKHFQTYRNIEHFITLETSGAIKIHSCLKENAISEAYNLKLALLKTTIIFNYTVLLLTRSSINKEDIIDELNISTSYLNKLTKQLNTFFFTFRFTITKNNGIYAIEGNEMNIRLFSYIFLQDSFQDLEWPFHNITIESIQRKIPKEILVNTHKRSNTKNSSSYILYAVLQTRIKKKNYITSPKSILMKKLFSMVQDNLDVALFFHQDTFGKIDEETKKIEINYFNFLSRIFISDIVPINKKIKLGKYFFEAEHPYCQRSRDILRSTANLVNNGTSIESLFLFTYHITLFNAFYLLVDDVLPAYTSLFIPSLSFFSNINDQYMITIKNKIRPFANNDVYSSLLSSLLYTLYTCEIKSNVKIYLQMSKDFTARFYIEKKLGSFFNTDQIEITDDYSLSDIIVTDTLERNTVSKHIFYLDSVSNNSNWEELLYLIQRVYLDKQRNQIQNVRL